MRKDVGEHRVAAFVEGDALLLVFATAPSTRGACP